MEPTIQIVNLKEGSGKQSERIYSPRKEFYSAITVVPLPFYFYLR